MTPRDILTKLERKGIMLEPKLTVEASQQPDPETLHLLKTHRDDILRYLLTRNHGAIIDMCRNSEDKVSGAVWCKRCFRYQLNPCVPSDRHYGEV
jgi:hypothetical protein